MTDFSELIPSRTNSPFRRKAFDADWTGVDEPEYGVITWYHDWQWDGEFGDVVDWRPNNYRDDPYYLTHPHRAASSECGITAIIEEFSDEWVKSVAFS